MAGIKLPNVVRQPTFKVLIASESLGQLCHHAHWVLRIRSENPRHDCCPASRTLLMQMCFRPLSGEGEIPIPSIIAVLLLVGALNDGLVVFQVVRGQEEMGFA